MDAQRTTWTDRVDPAGCLPSSAEHQHQHQHQRQHQHQHQHQRQHHHQHQQARAVQAGRRACEEQARGACPGWASLMAINYKTYEARAHDARQEGAAGLGLGAWHCHNLSDRRDLEHLGRRGGRRVEARRLARRVPGCRGLRLVQGSEALARHGDLPLIGLVGLACARDVGHPAVGPLLACPKHEVPRYLVLQTARLLVLEVCRGFRF